MTTEHLDALVHHFQQHIVKLASARGNGFEIRKVWAEQAMKEVQGEMAFLLKAAEGLANGTFREALILMNWKASFQMVEYNPSAPQQWTPKACRNWPCALLDGHEGPCTTDIEERKTRVAEPIDWNIRDSSIEVPEDEL